MSEDGHAKTRRRNRKYENPGKTLAERGLVGFRHRGRASRCADFLFRAGGDLLPGGGRRPRVQRHDRIMDMGHFHRRRGVGHPSELGVEGAGHHGVVGPRHSPADHAVSRHHPQSGRRRLYHRCGHHLPDRRFRLLRQDHEAHSRRHRRSDDGGNSFSIRRQRLQVGDHHAGADFRHGGRLCRLPAAGAALLYRAGAPVRRHPGDAAGKYPRGRL